MLQATTQTKGRGRQIGVGIFFLVVAIAIFLLAQGTAGMQSTLVLTSQRAGVTIAAPDLVLPTAATLYVFAALAALGAAWQLLKGFQRLPLMISLIAGLFILAFLFWATREKSLNLTGMLVSSLVRATPIVLAALSALYSERSGVVNIGIEGMMLFGAFFSVVFASLTKNMFIGVLAGVLAGMVFGGLHALLSIRYRVQQIISGTGIIILALGLTSYLQRSFLNVFPELNQPGPAIPGFAIPLLWRIPVLGPVFFNQSPIIYLMFLLLAATQVIMFHTRWGLRVRSVGEHPKAADTLGINVFAIRYMSVLISGALAGLAGAYMSIGAAGRFNEGMTAGKGFLGIAAMIFGNWYPGGAFLGGLIFGFFDSWQEKLSILQVGIPVDLLGMAPYLATMIVLAGFVGRSRMPAADGTPYVKES
ncbi:MAG: ABC transporter permease [Chloroflexi bacterium RBG_16_58_14]|nr:MAG: ABC transporter permease [Chloroflexi bacterium RBG_16_58_14]